MKTYKVLRGYYRDVCEETLVLPEDLKLLYLDGDIGSGLTEGHNHYLGCIRKSSNDTDPEIAIEEVNEGSLSFYDLGDLLLIVIDNIKFISDSPEFYTLEEFNSEFEIDNYFIEVSEMGNFRKDKDGNIQTSEEFWVKGKTCHISKINKILGPCSVEISTVINYSDLYKTEIYDISLSTVSLDQLLFSGFNERTVKTIYKGDDSKYREMIEKVLNKIGYLV